MDIDQLVQKIKQLDLKVPKDKLQKIARNLVKEIKARTIDGYGVSYNREVDNFKPLKESTIKQRRRFKNLDGRTSPETSNQIQSGQLVDGIHEVVGDNSFDIQPRKDRTDDVDGQTVANAQEEMGRTIFKLEEEQIEKIKEQVKQEVIKQLKKSLRR